MPSDPSNTEPSSRKPFISRYGWLVPSQIDVNSFIEAAVTSPRLGVLNNNPFPIPSEARVAIFRNFVMSDIMSREG
ncbi:uncharacterized protein LACBIDRAFT_310589 [Laccaria bicolor S238N-H82]|uniref:Predicted protein n=1 Tax=Laccaria bicolor (strain S238N-H82 / ATCC MYA-4686) TaxID=486041 RepID=B0DUN1_LACBS|nr:uncharacterized protein LACBIDRAFT_310589 [Laccaria bicolor S238N-H82]EDR01569.1 predicted protein [Laccaria bicolor S238N-H82]|eukprot:XP_001887645.1 predicted protein [Laccaria bicolor S238N-H82]